MTDPNQNRSTFERHPARWIVGLLAFWLCATPLSIILSVWIGKHHLERSGLLGDTFGVVNSLFSGLALLGAIYAIILQQRQTAMQQEAIRLQQADIEKGEEQQERRLKIAQDTARLQTLSFFARLQIDSMTGATKEMQHKMWRLANFYGERALTMVKNMGESFDSVADILPTGGIIQMNSREGALSLLTEIANELASHNEVSVLLSQPPFDNGAQRMHVLQAAARLDRWMIDGVYLFGYDEVNWVSTVAGEMRQTASESVHSVDKVAWIAWCHKQSRFPRQITGTRRTIEELAKQ